MFERERHTAIQAIGGDCLYAAAALRSRHYRAVGESGRSTALEVFVGVSQPARFGRNPGIRVGLERGGDGAAGGNLYGAHTEGTGRQARRWMGAGADD